MLKDNAKLNRCKKLLETPRKVAWNCEPRRRRKLPRYIFICKNPHYDTFS